MDAGVLLRGKNRVDIGTDARPSARIVDGAF